MSCSVTSIPGSPWGSNKAYSALWRTSASQEILLCAASCPSRCSRPVVSRCPCAAVSPGLGAGWDARGRPCQVAELPRRQGRLEMVYGKLPKEGCYWGGHQERAFLHCNFCNYSLDNEWYNSRVLPWHWNASALLLSYAPGSLCGLERFSLNFHHR